MPLQLFFVFLLPYRPFLLRASELSSYHSRLLSCYSSFAKYKDILLHRGERADGRACGHHIRKVGSCFWMVRPPQLLFCGKPGTAARGWASNISPYLQRGRFLPGPITTKASVTSIAEKALLTLKKSI